MTDASLDIISASEGYFSEGSAEEFRGLLDNAPELTRNDTVNFNPPHGYLSVEQLLGCELKDPTTGFLYVNNRRQRFGRSTQVSADLVKVPDWLDLTTLHHFRDDTRHNDTPNKAKLLLPGDRDFGKNEHAFLPWRYDGTAVDEIAQQVRDALNRNISDETATICARELMWLGAVKRDRALGSYAARSPKAFAFYKSLLTADDSPIAARTRNNPNPKTKIQKLAEDLGMGPNGAEIIRENRELIEKGLINLALRANGKDREAAHHELITFVRENILQLRTKADIEKASQEDTIGWQKYRDVLEEIETDRVFMKGLDKKSPDKFFQYILGDTSASIYSIRGGGQCVKSGLTWFPVGLSSAEEYNEFFHRAGKLGWDRGDVHRGMPRASDESSPNFKNALQTYERENSVRNAQFEGHPWAFMMGEVMNDAISQNPQIQSKGYVAAYSIEVSEKDFVEIDGIEYPCALFDGRESDPNSKPVVGKSLFSSHRKLKQWSMPECMNPFLGNELDAYGIAYPEDGSPEVCTYYGNQGTAVPRIGVSIPRDPTDPEGITYDNDRIWDLHPVQLHPYQLIIIYQRLELLDLTGTDYEGRLLTLNVNDRAGLADILNQICNGTIKADPRANTNNPSALKFIKDAQRAVANPNRPAPAAHATGGVLPATPPPGVGGGGTTGGFGIPTHPVPPVPPSAAPAP